MRNEMLWKNVDDFSLPQKALIFAEKMQGNVMCVVMRQRRSSVVYCNKQKYREFSLRISVLSAGKKNLLYMEKYKFPRLLYGLFQNVISTRSCLYNSLSASEFRLTLHKRILPP